MLPSVGCNGMLSCVTAGICVCLPAAPASALSSRVGQTIVTQGASAHLRDVTMKCSTRSREGSLCKSPTIQC